MWLAELKYAPGRRGGKGLIRAKQNGGGGGSGHHSLPFVYRPRFRNGPIVR